MTPGSDLSEITGICGAELLPHAVDAFGQPAPIICTDPPHLPPRWHHNEETGTRWPPEAPVPC